MKVYVLTSGSYSDYHIVATTTDEKVASEIKKKFGANIEEFENLYCTDIHSIQGMRRYRVTMLQNGNTFGRTTLEEDFGYYVPEFEIRPEYNVYQHVDHKEPRMSVCCWARNTDHAVKIANEIRTQLIAQNKFKPHERGVWGKP